MSTLEMRYWPEQNGNGLSGWRITRKDRTEVKFPNDERINFLFKQFIPLDGATIRLRLGTCCFVAMPAGVSQDDRGAFLNALEKEIENYVKPS